MKKILSLILTVTMLLSLAVSVSAKGFSDVDENYAWAADSIEALVNEGIIDGFGDGTFRPGESITREQMIKLLSGAIGAFDDANLFFVERAYEMYKDDLADCADSEFIKQGAYLVYRGIMNLDEVVDFLCANNRNLELKRIEAAIFIAKVLDVEEWISVKGNAEIQLNFADSEEILDDYKKYVSCVAEYGIMGSMDDNMFRPKETVTRAQIAVMINRIADKKKFSFVGGTITDIDTLNGYMKVETLDRKIRKIALDTSASIHSDYEGNQYVYTYDEANVFYRLNIGAEISAILSDNKVQEYYIFRNSGEAYKGLYGGVVSSDNGNDIIITDIDNPESKESKKLSENLEVFYNGSYSESCDVLKTGDTITIELEDGVVIRVIGEPASATVENAKVSFIDYADNDEAVITVVDENNEEIKYLVKKDAEIVRNAAVSEVCEL